MIATGVCAGLGRYVEGKIDELMLGDVRKISECVWVCCGVWVC